jgi:hypothetical protein
MTTSLVPSLLLVCGAGLGPHGLAILTPAVLSFLDPAAPVGLVVFGIIAAMRIHTVTDTAHTVVAATLHATITGTIVTAAFLLVQPTALTNLFPAWNVLAFALGVAAATSLDRNDCIVPVIAGGLLLALIRENTVVHALLMTLQVAAVAALVAVSGWLLLFRASTTDEQRVSTFASALLLGGTADYLSGSALMCGVAAGGCWRLASTAVREHIQRDVTYAADSLLALVLILAGAHAAYSIATVTIAAAYTIVRATGRLAGNWLVGRFFPTEPRPATQLLVAPGAFGVAFALNMVRALGTEFAPALAVIVVGTIASSVIAALSAAERDA